MKVLQTLLFGIALFFSLGLNAQMVLEYEIPEAGESIALPLGGTVDVSVDWGDETEEQFTTAGNEEHVYSTSGTKTVTITGTLTHFGDEDNGPGNQFLTKVLSWDGLGLMSLSYAFYKSEQLTEVPVTLPTSFTDLSYMFYYAKSFNQEIGEWNTENITDMNRMFYYAKSFNQPLGTWDISKVTDLTGMFYRASVFNQDIGNWNTSAVTDMKGMFDGAKAFNQPIGNWNTENVKTMNGMFREAENFNQPIGNWNTANVTDMSSMFKYADVFNQPIGDWNTGSVTSFRFMFGYAKSFNQPIGSWNTENITDMMQMFLFAHSFNQPIGDWNTAKVTTMHALFNNAILFNQDIGAWNTESVTNMAGVFSNAESFNQDLNDWNTDKVTRMDQMFNNAKSFNYPLDNWNTENVYRMDYIFYKAHSFNQSLATWNIESVTAIEVMFEGTALCTDNYDATLNAWASQTVQSGLTFHGGDSKYSEASEAARATLAESWTITDGGLGTTEDDKCSEVIEEKEEEPTGVLNFSSENNFELYPNPVVDNLYINATSLSNYSVYSLTGNVLKEADGVGTETEIDLTEFPSGIYILQIESEAGIQTQRFSKQ